jgi:hypothetical protein
MVMGRSTQPAHNLQSAVDAEHALIIAHDVVLDAADMRVCTQERRLPAMLTEILRSG